ncbi:tetratricopeptide repeat domain protein [Microscilla marina ATCC 23134]|uniref:Tetratricopeptide repeat domain protein n=1 Tax=Microscilla marina ATCC 23134 TaxID=313606 RepID=A1ZNA2_MICM2|nr:tetratricopeptide repeat domain protein [Microscilla marina ATCC 23134]
MGLSANAHAQNLDYTFYASKAKQLHLSAPDSALYYAQQGVTLTDNKARKAYLYYLMGYVAKGNKQLNQAVAYYRKCLKYADVTYQKKAYTSLANIYLEKRKYHLAKSTLDMLLTYTLSNYDKLHVYNVKANIFRNTKQFGAAKLYYGKALSLSFEKMSKSHKNQVAGIFWDYAQMYFLWSKYLEERGTVAQVQEKLCKAIDLHQQAIALRKKNAPEKMASAIANGYAKVANIYDLQKSPEKALCYVDSSLAIKHPHLPTQMEALSYKAAILQQMQQYSAAYGYYKKADSLLTTVNQNPELQKQDKAFFTSFGQTLKHKYERLAKSGIDKGHQLQSQIDYFALFATIGATLLVLLFLVLLKCQVGRYRQRVAHHKARASQKLDAQKVRFQTRLHKLEHTKSELEEEKHLLEDDLLRLEANKQIELMAELAKAEMRVSTLYELEDSLNRHDDTPRWIQAMVERKLKELRNCDELMTRIATAYPYFAENLMREIEQRQIVMTQPKHLRLIFLLVAKKYGVDNDFIARMLGYTKAGIKSAKNILAQKFGYDSTVDFEEFLMKLTEIRPVAKGLFITKSPKKAS